MHFDEKKSKMNRFWTADVKNKETVSNFLEKYWHFMNEVLYYNHREGKGKQTQRQQSEGPPKGDEPSEVTPGWVRDDPQT